jgi:hypothetical protein
VAIAFNALLVPFTVTVVLDVASEARTQIHQIKKPANTTTVVIGKNNNEGID